MRFCVNRACEARRRFRQCASIYSVEKVTPARRPPAGSTVDAILLRKFEELPTASEVFASGSVIFAEGGVILKQGFAIPYQAIANPCQGCANP